MAIARVNDVYRQDTNSTSPTHTITGTTTGNGLIISFIWGSSTTTISSVAMSGETVTAFTNGARADAGIGGNVALYYVKSLSSGGSKTVTATLSGSQYWTCALMEISSQDTSVFDDGSAAGAENLSANPSLPITTTVNNAMIYAMLMTQSSNASQGAGFSATGATWSAFGHRNFAEYKADAGALGSTSAPFVLSADRWLGIAAAVRAASAAAAVLEQTHYRWRNDTGPLVAP